MAPEGLKIPAIRCLLSVSFYELRYFSISLKYFDNFINCRWWDIQSLFNFQLRNTILNLFLFFDGDFTQTGEPLLIFTSEIRLPHARLSKIIFYTKLSSWPVTNNLKWLQNDLQAVYFYSYHFDVGFGVNTPLFTKFMKFMQGHKHYGRTGCRASIHNNSYWGRNFATHFLYPSQHTLIFMCLLLPS